MNRALRTVALLVIVSAAYVLPVMAQGQSAGSSQPSHDILSCSPAPCVLPPVQASEGSQPVVEAPITANPRNPNNLLLGSVDSNCPEQTLGFYFSADGGTTWTRTDCMPDIHTQERDYIPNGDPMVAYDHDGRAYIAGVYGDSEGFGYGLLALQESDDGVDWSTPAIALSKGYSYPFDSWMAIDTSVQSPRVNSVYMSAALYGEAVGGVSRTVVTYSNNGGRNWNVVGVDPPQTYPAFDDLTHTTIGIDGTVYVAWHHCPGTGGDTSCDNGTAYMLSSKSHDGGTTWSRPVEIAAVKTNCQCGTGLLPNTNNVRVYNRPVIGVDKSNGPYAGTLYAAMYSWTGSYMRVQVIRSTDGGNTWSKPVYVAPPSDTHDQFFPWLSVSSTGLVGVSWLDRRNDPNNVKYQAFAAVSRDGGLTFQPNVQLTQAFSDPTLNDLRWMGDYTGNTWAGSDFVAAWMDDSNGVNMQDVIGGIKLK